MKKYVRHLSVWTIAVACTAAVAFFNARPADPADDFSFTVYREVSAEEIAKLMSAKQVTEILVDHLDLFPRSQAPKLAAHLLSLCTRFRFDPSFILSLIQVESSFRIKAVSPVNARGLMQLMPDTAELIARKLGVKYRQPDHLFDPYTNLTLGIAYLSMMRDRYRGFPPYFIAAYNAGPGKLDGLLLNGKFKPVETRKYHEAIRSRVPYFKFYRSGGRSLRSKKIRV